MKKLLTFDKIMRVLIVVLLSKLIIRMIMDNGFEVIKFLKEVFN